MQPRLMASIELRLTPQAKPRRRDIGCVAWLAALSLTVFTSCADSGPESPKSDRGLSYQHDRIKDVPWSIHIAKVDRNEASLELHSVLAKITALGLSTVSEQALSVPSSWGTPVVAVNGDFYNRENSSYAGDPRGMQIVEGEVVSTPAGKEYSVFWLDAAGQPHATNVLSEFKVTFPGGTTARLGLNEERSSGRATLYTSALGKATRNRGAGMELVLEKSGDGPWLPLRVGETYHARIREVKDTGPTPLIADTMVLAVGDRLAANETFSTGAMLRISTETIPSLKGARTAIGGGSVVAREGKVVRLEKSRLGSMDFSVRSMFEPHPRSMLGWNKTHYYLAEVDGRQRGLSRGMTLEEVGEYMVKIGCETAMSLDGGGSATFWYRGRVLNSPCDGSERRVANSLVVVRKPPRTP